MICPKCGAEISDNANRCGNCGLKVNIRCPECNTINPFGTKFCKNCGFDFLINCPVCGSTNIYLAKECCKCHSGLESTPKQKQQEIQKEQKSKIKINTEVEVVNAFSSLASTYTNKKSVDIKEEKPVVPDEIKEPDDKGIPFVEDTIIPQPNINHQIFQVEEETPSEQPEEKLSAENVEHSQETTQEPLEVIEENIETIEQEITSPSTAEAENIEDVLETLGKEEQKVQEDILELNETEPLEEIEEYEEEQQSEDNTENIQEEESIVSIQSDAVEKVINLLTNSLKKHIVAINGSEGSGKTAILGQVCSALSKNGYIALYGSCTPLVQITSFGFFQDAFLRMMGFPPYTNNIDAFTKEFKKSEFAKIFSSMNAGELNLFLNMFYPTQKDVFENILENKKKMFTVLEKAIKSFLSDNNLIIVIDNFELLDGASYDFLMHILKKKFFNNRLKLLVAYQENKSIQSYFDITSDEEQIFDTILINKLEKDEIIKTVNNSFMFNIEDILDEEYLDKLVEKSDGNAIRLEQEIALLIDTGYINISNEQIVINPENAPDIQPTSFEELIKLRLNALTPSAKNILYIAAIMGYRFATGVLCQVAGLSMEKATQILSYLFQEMYITQVDNYTCEFKNLTLWKLIYQEAKNDLLYKENSEKLYNTLKQYLKTNHF